MNIIINKNISIKTYIIITIFAILIGLALIFVAIKGFLNVNIFKTHKKEIGEISYSSIVNTKKNSSEEESHQRMVQYTYYVDNKEYKGEGLLWWRIFNSDKNMKKGDKIDIHYNINNPSQSEIYHISYGLILIGICIIVISSLSLKQRLKEE